MASKLKIAIEFFGHLRTYKECVASVKEHLLDKYDCDVFMHTWSETEHNTKTWHKFAAKAVSLTSDDIKYIRSVYALKDIAVEHQHCDKSKDFLLSCRHDCGKTQISSSGLKFMLYSQYKVNELRKKYQKIHDVHYDYVIMLRPDILLKRDFILDDVHKEIQSANLKMARFSAVNIVSADEFPIIGNNASDILFFSSPEMMDQIVNTLNVVDFKKHKETFWNPETLFSDELLRNNVSSSFIKYLYGSDWEILRPMNKQGLRKNIIKLKVKINFLRLNLLEIIPWNILDMRFSVFSHFYIEFSLGAKK